MIPVKSFDVGKARLAGYLDAEARAGLGRAFAERTASVAENAGLLPLIVSGDAAVGEWALRAGFPTIEDTGSGLDGAAAAGAAWARESRSAWIVLHADLPLLRTDDLVDAGKAILRSPFLIAPSADGGTSALGGRHTVSPAYGPGSFRRHLSRYPEAEIIVRTGLLLDVDSPDDLRSASRHRRGQWLEKWVR